jgi:hypothetical protein
MSDPFKSAAELGITERERCALIEVMCKLQSGEIPGTLQMEYWQNECGTEACIAGWSHLLSKGEAFPELKGIRQGSQQPSVLSMFDRIGRDSPAKKLFVNYDSACTGYYNTPANAAKAIKNFLMGTKDNPWRNV